MAAETGSAIEDAPVGASAVRLIGGEMLTGSDPAASSTVDATVLSLIGDALPRAGRVLLAGPHDQGLVTALTVRGLAVDLLLRRLPDAREEYRRAGEAGEGADVRVFCGGLDRLTGDTYNAVLAFDGTDRLCGPDSPPLSREALIRLLARLVAPAGLLALVVPNGLGVTRLAGLTKPADGVAGLRRVAEALGDAGLRTGPALAVYPGFVAHEALLADADDGLAALVAAACAAGYAERQVLSDPAELARDAVRHGLGVRLAPAWLVLAARGAEPPTAREGALETDRQTLPFWSTPQLITRGSGGLRREPLDPRPRTLAHLRRDPAALKGPLPAGRTLEESLLTACAAEDLAEVRALVRRYLRWLRDGAVDGSWRAVWSDDAPGTGQLCPAVKMLSTLDTVLDADGAPVPVDPSWVAELPVPAELVLIHALQRFSYRLLAGGHAHPWPAGVSPDRLAVTLAATAGVTVSPRDLAAATAFAVYLEGPLQDATGTGDAVRYARLRERWAADPGRGAVAPRGYREALATIGTLSAELAEARAQIKWLDATIADRDTQLSAMGALRKSVTYRIGYLFTFPYHLLLRLLRRELRRWRQG